MDTYSHFAGQYCVLLALSVLACTPISAQDLDSLITFEQGELPIILSAPHGGRDPIPGAKQRLGKGVSAFVTRPDLSTDRLTESVADAIEKELGKRPFVIIARFQRKYLDANRTPAKAYECAAAEQTYDAYHRALTEARQQVIERWGYGLLLDLHGQNSHPTSIFRGTNNGRTTQHLVSRFGLPSLTGTESLFGELAQRGFDVIPKVASSDRENASYNGGYIVAKYGSREEGTLDAIQLDIGRDLRLRAARQDTANKLAAATAAFTLRYLQTNETSERP
jgi:N-formylglutamate amidohydrolase